MDIDTNNPVFLVGDYVQIITTNEFGRVNDLDADGFIWVRIDQMASETHRRLNQASNRHIGINRRVSPFELKRVAGV